MKKIGRDAFADCSSLSRVSYSGSQEDWEAITIESGNGYLNDAYEESLLEEKSSAFREKQTRIMKVKSKARRKVTVKWKKVSGAEGYQVGYSRKYSMAGSKKKAVRGTSTVLKKLARRKNYYVRVRAYKYIGGEKVYTFWSSRWSIRVR